MLLPLVLPLLLGPAMCKKFEPERRLLVHTDSILEVQQSSFTVEGSVIFLGSGDITQYGFCYTEGGEPNLKNSVKSEMGIKEAAGTFQSTFSDLEGNTDYFVRAYAVDQNETAYGEVFSVKTTLQVPEIQTTSVTSITQTTAQCGGSVIDDGGASVTERGVCWSTSQNPTLTDNQVNGGSGTGTFTISITGLNCNTTYYVRAYAINASGTAYGKQKLFTTSECTADMPTLFTASISNVTETSAVSGGNITDDGGAMVTARGVCWSLSQNPALSDSFTIDGNGTGGFTSSITGLTSGLRYYVRAYATNASGTAYGDQLMFTTTSLTKPSVNTTPVTNITETTAQTGGNVTDEGGAQVTSKGVCWSTSQNPTISDGTTSDGSGSGEFISQLTGLNCGTTYYIRAYATSSAGISYGSQESFTTSDCPAGLPEVTTTAISNITSSSAQSGGEVISDGGATVTARGVCWSTSPSPTTIDSKTSDGIGTGLFTSTLTGLETNTQYYVRAFATNNTGTDYGDEVSFNTNTAIVTDYDGNNYQTILIGDQTWMAENMKATHYSDGTAVPLVENNTMWDALTETGKAYCWNDNNSTTGETYGALYTWAAAMNGLAGSDINPSGVQGVCPTGWHLPSDSEWKQMEIHLSMTQTEADKEGWRGTNEGGKLKETGTTYWNSPNTGATNTSGFTALPGGNRYDYGAFFNVGSSALFWTATDYSVKAP